VVTLAAHARRILASAERLHTFRQETVELGQASPLSSPRVRGDDSNKVGNPPTES